MAATSLGKACRDASRDLRRLPRDVRDALKARTRPEVADPLADTIRGTFRGPYAAVLSAATKTRVSGDPKIVVGGARRAVSGGASPRDLVFGSQFGGGSKVTQVTRKTRRGSVTYRRHTTRQFTKPRPTIYPTIRQELPTVLDRFATIIEEVFRGNARP